MKTFTISDPATASHSPATDTAVFSCRCSMTARARARVVFAGVLFVLLARFSAGQTQIAYNCPASDQLCSNQIYNVAISTDESGFAKCKCCSNQEVFKKTQYMEGGLSTFYEIYDCKSCAEGYINPVPTNRPCYLQYCPAGFTGYGSCTPCKAGEFKAYQGGHACSKCLANEYQDKTGQAACKPCPLYSISPEASTAITNCLCNAGYTKSNDNTCIACVAGKYKANVGFDACNDCESGKTSPAGSTSLTACSEAQAQCLASSCKYNYLPNEYQDGPCHCCAGQRSKSRFNNQQYQCLVCLPGTYMNQYNHMHTACLTCADGKQSSSDGIELFNFYPLTLGTACIDCVPGKYNKRSVDGIHTCEPCLPGSYNTLSGQTVCQQCTPGKYASYRAEGNTGCSDCEVGKITESHGASACEDCLPGKYQHDSACLVRKECSDASTGQVESSVCKCDSGWMSEYKEVMKVSGSCSPELDGLYEAWPEQPFKNQFWNKTTDQGNQYMLQFYEYKYNYESFIITKWPNTVDSPLDILVTDMCKYTNDCKRQKANAFTMDIVNWPARSGWFELKPSEVSRPWFCPKLKNGAYEWEQSSTFIVETHFTSPKCKCPEGTYRVSGGKSCLPCPSNSTSARNSEPNACVCNAGYAPMRAQGSATPQMPHACSACTPGKFKSTRSRAPANASDSYFESEKCQDCAKGEYAKLITE